MEEQIVYTTLDLKGKKRSSVFANNWKLAICSRLTSLSDLLLSAEIWTQCALTFSAITDNEVPES